MQPDYEKPLTEVFADVLKVMELEYSSSDYPNDSCYTGIANRLAKAWAIHASFIFENGKVSWTDGEFRISEAASQRLSSVPAYQGSKIVKILPPLRFPKRLESVVRAEKAREEKMKNSHLIYDFRRDRDFPSFVKRISEEVENRERMEIKARNSLLPEV